MEIHTAQTVEPVDPLAPAAGRFFEPAIQRSPFAYYRRLRAEQPVFWDAALQTFIITRENLIRAVAMDPGTYSSVGSLDFAAQSSAASEAAKIRSRTYQTIPLTMVLDPPLHTEYRHIMNSVLSQQRMRDAHGLVESLVENYWGALLGKGGGEFIDEFAVPLPFALISTMMGLGPDMFGKMREWAEAYRDPLSGRISAEREIECAHLYVEYHEFFARQVEERRAMSAPPDDLVSAIATARLGNGELMRMVDALSMIEQFVAAGAETTTNALGSGMLHLVQHPELLKFLRDNDAKVEVFVEEVLRLYAPAQGLFRIATRDVVLEGVNIPKGGRIMIRFGAGNTDERAYEDPETLDLNRKHARGHLSFGHGIHRCQGATLARSELAATYRRIARTTASLALAGEVRHAQALIAIGVERLPFRATPL